MGVCFGDSFGFVESYRSWSIVFARKKNDVTGGDWGRTALLRVNCLVPVDRGAFQTTHKGFEEVVDADSLVVSLRQPFK